MKNEGSKKGMRVFDFDGVIVIAFEESFWKELKISLMITGVMDWVREEEAVVKGIWLM